MNSQKNAMRNRAIFAAYQRGISIREVAQHYDLSVASVGHIIRDEGHKIAVSIDVFYKAMRSQKPIPEQ